MSQQNSLSPFTKASVKDLLESIGITQFTSETNWYQVIGGLIIQGGFISSVASGTTINFNTSFTKQCLGVWLEPTSGMAPDSFVNTVTNNSFAVGYVGLGPASFYWFAIGV